MSFITLDGRRVSQHGREGGHAAAVQTAIRVAQEKKARCWELRATTSLCRVLKLQDRCAEAHDLLAPVYGSLAEGFATPALQEARTLLEELASSRGALTSELLNQKS